MSVRDLARTSSVARVRAREEHLPSVGYSASGERLTASQERVLTARAQAGDRYAEERVLQANVPLVMSVARQFASSGLEREDLVQEGMIGLTTAVRRFEGERGVRFSTYATYWIRQRILRALDRQSRLIRLPVDVAGAARRAASVKEQLTEKLGREPTLEEMAPECGVSASRLGSVLACLEEPISLDAATGDDSEGMTLDVADPDAVEPIVELMRHETRVELNAWLEALPSRDRMVIEARFGLKGNPVPLADLAEKLRLTREGVRQIQRRAILKLRRHLELQMA